MTYFTFSLTFSTKSLKSGMHFILTTYPNLNAKFLSETLDLDLYVDFENVQLKK